jgi:Integrase zinc binding domain/RNase H-like domain found in reverse transcriptase/Reverse transcriptase (RNA-dependent DNA polymerase)
LAERRGLRAEEPGGVTSHVTEFGCTVQPNLSANVHAFQAIHAGPKQIGDLTTRLSRRFDPMLTTYGATASVGTLYKKKGQKVLPKNMARLDEEPPGGNVFWKEQHLKEEAERLKDRKSTRWDKWLIPRFAREPEGTRLTMEREGTLPMGSEMTPQEREVLTKVLRNREMALAWDFGEMGKVRPEVAPPQEIHTVSHEPWQAPSFPVPKALHGVVSEMLRERLKRGILEPCHGPYRNPWFLVKKNNGKYRLINAAMNINRVTIKDANLPPNPDEFAEEFAGMVVGSYIDFFSGYDQLELAKRFRDLTAIATPLGLFRQTTVLQGATNSVAQFVRVITKILQDWIPHVALPYLDDIGVKGPRTRYNEEEVPGLPGVRRFMLEHIQNLDRVLADIERSGTTIAAEKSKFCMAGLKVVGFVCDADGRHPDKAKVVKILEWPDCRNVTEARAFMGICVYYRIWIREFSIIALPIFVLFRKDVLFVWGFKQREAMENLKEALTTAPALMPLQYGEGAGEIIFASDGSLEGWGCHVDQLDAEGRRHPSRFLSGIWSESERKYDAGKRECRALLKGLKKVRQYLYGVHFVIELDAKTLIAQLNRSATDLPGALVTRWIAWIRLFDFELRHIPGKKHSVADGLSRRPRNEDEEDQESEVDIDDFIDAELDFVRVAPLVREVQPVAVSLTVRVFPFGFARGSRNGEGRSQRRVVKEEKRKDVKKTNKPLTINMYPYGFGLDDEREEGEEESEEEVEEIEEEAAGERNEGGRIRQNLAVPYSQNETSAGGPSDIRDASDGPSASSELNMRRRQGSEWYETTQEEEDDEESGAESEEEVWDEEDGYLRSGYNEESAEIAQYLRTLRRPLDLSRQEFRRFKYHALQFLVRDGHLFRRASKNIPLRRVVDSEADRLSILHALHDDCGHRGREGTYRRIADRYWWKDLSREVAKYCRSCQECQRRAPNRQEEALHPTWVSVMWQKVALDIVYMPPVQGYKYLVLARDDLSGWVEGKPLVLKTAAAVAKFIWEGLICRFGIFGRLVVDGGRENTELVTEMMQRYGTERVVVSAYHPQANGMVERGHRPIVDSLAKLAAVGRGNWLQNLAGVLWADRVTTRTTTGVSAYRMMYGYEPVLPIETELPTWSFLKWSSVRTREELLTLRTLQLQRRDDDLEEMHLRMRRKREEGKEQFDQHHQIRKDEINAGDLVLLHNTQRKMDMTRQNKLAFRWLGPYRVKIAIQRKGTFVLEELDGTELGGTVAGNRLKKFHERDERWQGQERSILRDATENEEEINELVLEDGFEAGEKSSTSEEDSEIERSAQRRMQRFIGVYV